MLERTKKISPWLNFHEPVLKRLILAWTTKDHIKYRLSWWLLVASENDNRDTDTDKIHVFISID